MKAFVIYSIENHLLHYCLLQIAGLLWDLPLEKAYLLLSRVYLCVQSAMKRCHSYPLAINEANNAPSFVLPIPQLKIQIPIRNASVSPELNPRGFLPRVL